jgi:predicted MFS family arabinose efflux permease
VFRAAISNPTLRRVTFAYSLFGAAEYGIWLALLVFAYDHDGPTGAMVMALGQLIPSTVLSPVIGALADRMRPARVLCASYALQAVSIATVAFAVSSRAPVLVAFLLAPLTSLSLSATRPSQAALLPAIVRTPEELTAANVMTGWTEGASSLGGPALVGVLLAWRGPGLAISATAVMTAAATVLTLRVAGPATVAGRETGGDDAAGSAVGRMLLSIGPSVRSNLGLALANPATRILLVLRTFYYVLVGSLDLLCVILAVSVLHIGAGGAGYLNAALGGGALLAGFVTAFLVGRPHLANTLTFAIVAAAVALGILGSFPSVIAAFVLIAVVGLAGTVFDITGRTLWQRACPSDAIAGSFSVLEAITDLGLAAGAILVRVAIAIDGLRAALFAPAVVAVLLVAVLWRQLRKIDASATVPQVEIQLLRAIPIFAMLPAPTLEGVARDLVPLSVPAGTTVITEGDRGDRYYAIADGRLAVTRAGQLLATIGRGEGFGEIALVRDVPRVASVTTTTEALLYTLEKEPFVLTVTGHASASSAASIIVAGPLGDDRAKRDGPQT